MSYIRFNILVAIPQVNINCFVYHSYIFINVIFSSVIWQDVYAAITMHNRYEMSVLLQG